MRHERRVVAFDAAVRPSVEGQQRGWRLLCVGRIVHKENPRCNTRPDEWQSKADPDARVGKLKDGVFHLKYKAENAVDLDTEVIVAAEIYHGDVGDRATIEDTVNTAKRTLRELG